MPRMSQVWISQVWSAGPSRELDLGSAEDPQAGDTTTGLCLIQPMITAWVGNPAWVSQLPLCAPFPVPSLSRDALLPFCSTCGTTGSMYLTGVAPFGGPGDRDVPVLPEKTSVTLILSWRNTQSLVP